MCSLKRSRGWAVYTWLCALWRGPGGGLYIPDYVLCEEVQGVGCIYLTMCSVKKSRGWTVYTWLCALWRSPGGGLYISWSTIKSQLHPQIRSKPHILVLCISLFRSASICRYIPGVNMEICTGCQYGDMYRVSIWRYIPGVNMEINTVCQYGDMYRVSIWRFIQGVNVEIYTGCKYGDKYRVSIWRYVQSIYLTMCSMKKSRGWTVYTWLCALWRSPGGGLYIPDYVLYEEVQIYTRCQCGDIYRV